MLTDFETLKMISKPYPRKGTETRSNSKLSMISSRFQNHIPARGRKLPFFCGKLIRFLKFQNHIPARGRKHVAIAPPKIVKKFQNHIPARGRKRSSAGSSVRPRRISKPYPRKGTETRRFSPSRIALRISKPYPRKGTERISSLPCQSGGAVNVSQSHFADAHVLGTFSHTTCYPISCAQGLASWTGQQGDRVSGGGGAMDASRKPSIATEVHASYERPHRLALLATSPVATGEAKLEEPRKGTETRRSLGIRCSHPRFKNQNPVRGRSVPPASPARAVEGKVKTEDPMMRSG